MLRLHCEDDAPVPTWHLGHDETARIMESVRCLSRAEQGLVDEVDWVDAARAEWEESTSALRKVVSAFRRRSSEDGVLVLRGFPIGVAGLPETPGAEGSVQRYATPAAVSLVLVACGLGDPGSFQAEKSGSLVQDVVPVRGREKFQGNLGSVKLTFHNENAFHACRPDYIELLCLRADHDRVAGLRTACIRAALPLLPSDIREVLFEAEFSTEAPPSFAVDMEKPVVHAILSGDRSDPDVQVDFAATSAMTARAEDALHVLDETLEEVSRTTMLLPGDMAIVDNRVAVHGRTAFRPRYDGMDRWLQRCYSFSDIRRSRDWRPGDGYVLAR